ncbi:hypothetical protein DAPPUDRAFT_120489, partial [Daphnia pulex]
DFNVQQQQHSQPPRSLPQQQHVNEQLKQLLAEREFLREHSNVNSGGGEPPVVPSSRLQPAASSNRNEGLHAPCARIRPARPPLQRAEWYEVRVEAEWYEVRVEAEWYEVRVEAEWYEVRVEAEWYEVRVEAEWYEVRVEAEWYEVRVEAEWYEVRVEAEWYEVRVEAEWYEVRVEAEWYEVRVEAEWYEQSPVSDWNLDHVGNNWLRSIGLETYVVYFTADGMRGEELLTMESPRIKLLVPQSAERARLKHRPKELRAAAYKDKRNHGRERKEREKLQRKAEKLAEKSVLEKSENVEKSFT